MILPTLQTIQNNETVASIKDETSDANEEI